MQAHGLRNADTVKGDVGVLHHPQRRLPVDLLQGDAVGLAVHEEGFDLTVGGVAGEHAQHVGGGGTTDPALGTVNNPGAAVAVRFETGGGGQAAGDVRSVLRLGQGEDALEREIDDLRHPLALLLRRGADPDGGAEQAGLGGVPGGQGGVGAGKFEDPEALVDPPGRPIHGELRRFHQVQVDQRPGELFREFAPFPVLGQQGLGLRVKEAAEPCQDRALRGREEGLGVVPVRHGVEPLPHLGYGAAHTGRRRRHAVHLSHPARGGAPRCP